MLVSVVTTMYRSAPFLDEFHRRIVASAQRAAVEIEVVYVNDGSPDDALARVHRMRQRYGHVRIVDLSRNFGHHPAIMTGLAHASGDRIFLIDCDLEESPELLEQFMAKMDETQADVVYGVQAARQSHWAGRILSRAYYWTCNALCDETIPKDLTTVRLLSRRYTDALLSHGESIFVLSSLSASTGFDQVPMAVVKQCKGSTTYTMKRKVRLLVRHIVTASSQPLYLIFYIGLVVLMGTAAVGLIELVGRMLGGGPSMSSSPTVLSIWIVGGLNLLCQGIIGTYLANVYAEVKRRPRTIVRQVVEPIAIEGEKERRLAG